ncbi:glutactin-like [Ochlerotatus camptorhynchus]|uniref:glutactin-like n=1 Tax=Ochlerotatus camptorhynchus TaxID=644619 RepID=UPI0031DCC06C
MLSKLTVIVFAIGVISSNGQQLPPPIVNIQGLGNVQGSIGHTAWTNRPIFKFQAIPYGQSPIEGLRFKPTVNVGPWSGTKDASKPGVRCPQITMDYVNVDNEDCLTLSVYSNNLNATRPVMVYIHGGWFYTGGADMFKPDYLLESDIVLVVIQYRLGPLGFLSTMSEDIPGNAGMLDVIASLDWVQQHIGNFGGNSDEVTIFGQSAGASTVTAMLHSPLVQNRPLAPFRKAIIQSGSLLVPRHIADSPVEGAIDIANRMGCTEARIEKCFQGTSTKILLEAFLAHRNETIAKRGFPYVAATNIVVGGPSGLFPQHPKHYHQYANKEISIMAGTVSQDGLFLLDELYRMQPTLPKSFNSAHDLLLYVRTLHEKFGQTRLDGAMEAYAIGSNFLEREIDQLRWKDLVASLTDVCSTNGVKAPVLTEVHAFSRVNPDNVYLNSFDYASTQNAEIEYTVPFPHKGAVAHADELHYLFPVRALNADDIKMAKIMVKLWTSFAIRGVPSADDIPFWPPASRLYGPYLKINTVSEQGSNYRNEFTATAAKYRAKETDH